MFGISIEAESSQGVSQVNGLPSLMEFFSTHVFPELQDGNHQAQKMLKATAVKFVMTFRNQFSKEQLVALTPLLITHLASPIVVVHTYAAMTIERIMTTKDETKQPKFGIDELRPFLNTIFAALFGIIDNTNNNENEYAMKCIMRTLSVAGADIVPATQEVLDKLTPALARVAKNPRNPQYNHFLFESIAVLVKSVCQVEPTAAAAFEPLLFAQFQTILQMDVSEFTPYVFQIFAQLLEFRTQGTGLGEAYTNMLQPCLSPTAWERKGNIPALTRLLRAYLQQGAVEIVSSGSFMAMLGVWQKLVSSKANEQSSFELLSAIVRYVPPDALHPVWGQLYGILFRRLQASKTPRFTRLITNFFALFVGKFGSQAFFDQLNSMQPGMGLQIMMQVWLPRLKTDAPVRLDAKMHVVALTKLSCETAALLSDDNAKQLWGQTVATVVFLLTSPDAMIGQQVTDDGSAEMEISYDSSFSNLHFARKPAEDPFAEIADPARSFSQALGALSTSHPGHLQPIIQQSVGADPKLTTGLQTLLNSAGVQLA
jgi:exportin-2 (importin alpha re-exporter)